jgi:hypothetical protein
VRVVGDFADTHDLILLAVRRDKITAACQALTKAPGVPTVLVFGNNSAAVPPSRATFPARSCGASRSAVS